MTSIFEDEAPIPLDELVTNTPSGPKLPEKVARNEAAYTALMTAEPVRNYQTMMAENQQGSSETMEQLQAKVNDAVQNTQMQDTLELVGRKDVPMGMKQQLIEGMKNKRSVDPKKKFLEASFVAPSEGETLNEQEARLTTAEVFDNIYKSANRRQAIVDGFAASRRDDVYAESVAQVGIPFAQSKIIASGSKPGVWNTIKGFFLPGKQIKDEQKLYASLTPEGKADYLKNDLIPRLESMNLVGWGDAHLQQIDYLRAVTEGEEYLGTLGSWALNLQNVLDAVGMGWTIRSARKASQGAKAVPSTNVPIPPQTSPVEPPKGLPEAVMKPAMVQQGDLARVSPATPTRTGVSDATASKIDTLEKEYASLLESSSQAGKGDVRGMREELSSLRSNLKDYGEDAVKELAKRLQKGSKLSYKEALKEAEKRIGDGRTDIQASIVRIESQIASNADAAKVHNRLGEIEKELTSLKKQSQTTVLKKTAVAQAVEQYDELHRIELNGIVKQEQPGAPLSAMLQSNPQKARETVEAIKQDVDGEFTKAMTGGNSPEQALIDTLMPSAVTSSGKITAKTPGLMDVDHELWVAYQNAGATALTEGEKAGIRDFTATEWKNAEGIHIHEGMGGLKISSDGNYMEISAAYGTPNGAFLKAEDAIATAELALRNSGVTKEDITILARDGLDYKPVKLEEVVGKDGSYLIQINRRLPYDLSSKGMTYDPFTIKRNWFDREIHLANANVARNLLDPASMIDPIITRPIGAAADKAIHLESQFIALENQFVFGYKGLNKGSQRKVMDYIKLADEKSIAFDELSLRAQSWTDKEIQTVRDWKKFQDNQWYFENADLNSKLTTSGYMKYVGGSGEDFIAKPVRVIPKESAIAVNQKVGTYLDPVTGKLEYVTKTDEEMLHAAGGTYAKLRRPVTVDGVRVEYIKVQNSPGEYLRALRENDVTLPYRDGHYTRHYKKGAMFVDEVEYTTGSNGQRVASYRRAVAVGPDTPSAKAYADNLNKNNTNPKVVYEFRQDDKGFVVNSDAWWDFETARGRIAQRHRGKTLDTFGVSKHVGEGTFIVDPVSSAAMAAQSMGYRMGMRAAMDTMKARIEKQYGHLFPNGKIPETLNEISSKGVFATKEIADARTSVAAYHYYLNGYHNTLDKTAKGILNAMGTVAGNQGMARTERALKGASEWNPSMFFKHSAFYAYIVMGNIPRQILLQASAGNAAMFFNPKNVVKGQLFRDVGDYWSTATAENLAQWGLYKFSGKKSDFSQFVDDVGIVQSVHKNNLISGATSDLVEERGPIGSLVHTVGYKAPLEAGFIKGEQQAQLMWHSTIYREMQAKGLDMTDPVNIETAASRIRALTGEMNSKGEFAYQQGSVSALTQFMAVPHKVFASMANRKLSPTDRTKYMAAQVLLYGSIGGAMTEVANAFGADIFPEDQDLRYAVTEGIQAFIYNEALRKITGDDKMQADLASFNQLGIDQWVKTAIALSELDIGKVVAQSPATGIFHPEKGRVPLALRELARYVHFSTPDEDTEFPLPPATAQSVLQKVLEISSGYSKYAKGEAALRTGKWKDAKGALTVGDPTEWEAKLVKYMGIEPKALRQNFIDTQTANEASKDFKDKINADYDLTSRILADHYGESKENLQHYLYATNFFMARYKNSPEAMKIIQGRMQMDLTDPESKRFAAMIKAAGVMNRMEYINFVKQSGASPEAKELLLKRFNQEFPETKE